MSDIGDRFQQETKYDPGRIGGHQLEWEAKPQLYKDELFRALGRSRFRSRFQLSGKDADYLRQKGLETIIEHARDLVTKRLADAYPANDGRQTPMRNHPVFVAQHATGTCCRKCLEKWHHIPRGKPLTETDISYMIEVLKRWLIGQNVVPPASAQEERC